jgi:hypothetical protein
LSFVCQACPISWRLPESVRQANHNNLIQR